MKAATFEYLRATSVDQALGWLEEAPEESKIIAGGQSLVPMMNFRLARPERLIDISGIGSLRRIDVDAERLIVGALATHRDLEHLEASSKMCHLLRDVAGHIGHLPIRTRGTFGGSLVHADPASEWCVVARLLDATLTVTSRSRGTRHIPAADFFETYYSTAMAEDELLVSVRIEDPGDTHHSAFLEFARRAGDFAIVSAAVDLEVHDGMISRARVCLGGVSDVPARIPEAESVLTGSPWRDAEGSPEAAYAAGIAAAEAVTPASDLHGSAEYRRDLVRALLPRAVHRSSTGFSKGKNS